MSRRTVQRRIRKIGVSHFEKFVTGCNEKADELAKAGEMLYEGLMAEARAKTEKQERERKMYAALQCAASFHCLVEEWKDCEELKTKPKEEWIFVDKKTEDTKHRTGWCAEANEYRSVRCGRGSKYMKMQGQYTEKGVRRVDRQGEVLVWAENARFMRGREWEPNR